MESENKLSPLRSPNELNFLKNMVADILSDAEHSFPEDGDNSRV